MSNRIRIALIYGSTREGRFCDTVAGWVVEQISRHDRFELDRIDPAELALPERMERTDGPAIKALEKRLAAADAYVVVTPEYNHSFPAPLKSLIDSVYSEWQVKPVSFVSYGGVSGGLRAVEQLRLVFAELHAVTVRDSVSFASAWEQFDDRGRLRNPKRAEKSMATMLTKLNWWAVALRDARARLDYGGASL